MHCLNSYTLLEATISKLFLREAVNDHFWYQTNSRGASAMASIYEKPPHFVLEKTWDEKTLWPETYKLQESRRSAHTPMPSNGNASNSGEIKAKENFYLSEGKKNKHGGCLMCLLPCTLARAARSVIFQTSISIWMKHSKMPSSRRLKLQTLKTGFKSKTRVCILTNDGPCTSRIYKSTPSTENHEIVW